MEKATVYSFSFANSQESKQDFRPLVEKAVKGDQEAFGDIYEAFFKRIFQFIFYRVGHKQTAEDLTEEVFIKAFTRLESLAAPAAFEGWLYQIARNRIIDHYREKRTWVDLDEIENTLEYESNILESLDLEADQKYLLKFLRQLEPDQQKVLKLKFFEHLENSEISTLLNKSEGAIRVIQHRALNKLKDLTSASNSNPESRS